METGGGGGQEAPDARILRQPLPNLQAIVLFDSLAVDSLVNKGTWCSWLSRSLSICGLREGSGSIPDVSNTVSKRLFFRLDG